MVGSQKCPQAEPPRGAIRIEVVCEWNKDMRLVWQVPLAGQQMHRGPAGLQNPKNLSEIFIGVPRMLQDGCAQHNVETLVVERQPVRIRLDLLEALRDRRCALPL